MFELGARAAAITHGQPTGYLAAGMLSAMVQALLQGGTLRDAAERAKALLVEWPGHQETLAAAALALALAEDDGLPAQHAVAKLGAGWIAEEALAIGLCAALKGEDFQQVLAIGANHSGDSDSTASIAGQLWGAWRGLDGMPQRWIQALDLYRPLVALVSQSSVKLPV